MALKTLSSSDVEALSHLLLNDNIASRDKVFSVARENKELYTPRFNVLLAEQRQLAYNRLKNVCESGVLSIRDFDRNPRNIFAVHEACSMLDPSFATKLTVQFNLFGGTVWRLGTEKHHSAIERMDRFDEVGCFALTELGYGNNAIEMETTATFDAATEEWVIHSPSLLSQKFWITNGALHAHWAIVFAQTKINGKEEGIHGFMVQIRDLKTLKPCSGVTIEDMGHRIGSNGVDNAKLHFENVRVPADALLDRMSQLVRNPTSNKLELTSAIKGRRERFIAMADQLLSGRVCIASMMLGGLKISLANCIKYSQSRFTVGPNGKSSDPLISYQIQQAALTPLFSRAVVLNLALNETKDLHAAVSELLVQEQKTGVKSPHFASAKADFLLLCCAVKPALSWLAERTAATCRERCGGMGYLSASLFGELWGSAHAGVTAEGDNTVLWQKVAKELLALKATEGKSGWRDAVSAHVYLRDQETANKAANGLPVSIVESISYLSKLLDARQTARVTELSKIMSAAAAAKKKSTNPSDNPIFDAWMHDHALLVQAVTKSFIERRAFERAVKIILPLAYPASELVSKSPNLPVINGRVVGSHANAVSEGAASRIGTSVVSRDALANCAIQFAAVSLREETADLISYGVLTPADVSKVHTLNVSSLKIVGEKYLEDIAIKAWGVHEDLLFAPCSNDWAEFQSHERPNLGEIVKSKL